MTTTVTLTGLHCPACKKLTEKRIAVIPGVTSVTVSPDTGITEIVSARPVPRSQIRAVLTDTPYGVA